MSDAPRTLALAVSPRSGSHDRKILAVAVAVGVAADGLRSPSTGALTRATRARTQVRA